MINRQEPALPTSQGRVMNYFSLKTPVLVEEFVVAELAFELESVLSNVHKPSEYGTLRVKTSRGPALTPASL